MDLKVIEGSQENEIDEEHPYILIPALLRQMYWLGWCSGTGGGFSMRFGYGFMNFIRRQKSVKLPLRKA